MSDKPPTPLQASFWLTKEETGYILALCAIFLVGIVARYFYLKNEPAGTYTLAGVEEGEHSRE